jgi:hypothetical protein
MEDYRKLLTAEFERRGVTITAERDGKVLTELVRHLENEMIEIGPVGVSMFVLGLLLGKGWRPSDARPV